MTLLDAASVIAPLTFAASLCLLAAALAPWISRRSRVGGRLNRLVLADQGGSASAIIPGEVAAPPKTSSPAVNAARGLLLEVGPVVAGVLLGLLFTGTLVLALLAGVLAFFIVRFVRHTISDKRRHLLEEQMVVAIGLLAGGLRAGYSLRQALQKIALDGPEPTAEEFTRAVREVELGTSTEEALMALAKRVGGEDYRVLALMMIVHRRVGGNLAQLLDALSETVRLRAQTREQIAALTAQQRLASYVLVALPVVVLILFGLIDPQFVRPLIDTPLGRIFLVVAGILLLAGWTGIRLAGRVEA